MLVPANLLARTEKTKINKCSASAEMGDRLAAIDMGRKGGGLCRFLWEGAHNVAWAKAYVPTK